MLLLIDNIVLHFLVCSPLCSLSSKTSLTKETEDSVSKLDPPVFHPVPDGYFSFYIFKYILSLCSCIL